MQQFILKCCTKILTKAELKTVGIERNEFFRYNFLLVITIERGNIMSTSQPIRRLEQLEELKNYYINCKPNMRNTVLIHLGLNTILRISDLLSLHWKDVYDFRKNEFRTHITKLEQKTKKENCIAMNKNALSILERYKKELSDVKPDDYLFPGQISGEHLSRFQAYRVIRNAAEKVGIEGTISCHSLRKTFGYHACKAGAQPAVLMFLFNHSSYHITEIYLGIEQDDKDEIFLNTLL